MSVFNNWDKYKSIIAFLQSFEQDKTFTLTKDKNQRLLGQAKIYQFRVTF